MKRIVIDARESGTSTGRYVDKLVEYLHKLQPKHEFIILTKPHRLDYLKKIAPSFQIIESSYAEFSLSEQIGFKRQLKNLKPDLVHFGMTQQPVLYRGSVVTTIHDLTTVRFRNPAKNTLVFILKQQVYKWVVKRAARKSKVVIAISEFVKNDVAQYTGVPAEKIVTIYHAADKISEASTPISSLAGEKFIMYVGRPMPHKNLPRLIESHQMLLEQMPDLKLVLAGKKDVNYQRLEDQAKKQGYKNIVFTDFISDGELKWLYENTACYVFPSLSEGFGLPGLEAMIHGAPVASSRATCLPEVYGEAAEYFDPADSRGMAKTISDVINNKMLRDRLIMSGYKQAQKYSWGKTAQQTFDIYLNVLS
jgi:glycosyltransferase involved in cell wall biosynthesis